MVVSSRYDNGTTAQEDREGNGMIVRSNLGILLKTAGLSQRGIAKEMGIPHQWINWMVKGSHIPTDDQLLEMSRILKVPVDAIYPDPRIMEVLAE